MSTTTHPGINIHYQRKQVPFILRAVWFLIVGWWLSGVFIALGYLFMVLVITAPLGFWFLNRVPQAQTLRLRTANLVITEKDGNTYISEMTQTQRPWYIRLLYLPVGLVFGLLWLILAWMVSIPVITLPLSIYMIDRAPGIITLQRH